MKFAKKIWNWITGRQPPERAPRPTGRQPVTHVIVLDGTNSNLTPGGETNAGKTYKLLRSSPASARLSLYYEAGIQWEDWRDTRDVATGNGINGQIRRAYGYLASRYVPGDKIILLGYSRGAYAVRSMAGILDRVGLLRADAATSRKVRQAFQHYQLGVSENTNQAFHDQYCHDTVSVQLIGVWDTVKALGLRLPILWKLTEAEHAFHDHSLSTVVERGVQALALDENRQAYAPVMWEEEDAANARVEQMWFRGAHGDIGGQLLGMDAARPLSNIPLVWMLEHLERCGVALPENWRAGFICDPDAPSVGTHRGMGKLFIVRKKRKVGRYSSERIHPTARTWPEGQGPDRVLVRAKNG